MPLPASIATDTPQDYTCFSSMAQERRHFLGPQSQHVHLAQVVSGAGLENMLEPDHPHRPIVNARAKNATVFRLFCDLFQDSIAEELYDVERAGLQFTVEPSTTALVIKAMGYNDKLQDLTTRMLGRLKEFVPTAERFASVKDLVGSSRSLCRSATDFWRMQLHRVWISTQSDEPYTLAAYYAEYALSERVYTPLEKLAELQSACSAFGILESS